ncbi:MAG: recombinase family protein [Pseudomonadota bacterium]
MGGNPPLGYDADRRSLKINEQEAAIVRRLFELYLKHRNLRLIIEQAEQLGLRSRRREGRDGKITGGKHFDRGHLHYILSNPVYAGRIRHKGLVHEGQHPAIIDTVTWDRVQEMLRIKAAKVRGTENAAPTSPLTGKLFDETSDRLTPSHSQKNGKRLRYYVSRRLIKGKRHHHPDAWRLPAEPLERLLTDVVSKHLSKPEAVLRLAPGLDASRVHHAGDALKRLLNAPNLLSVIDRVDLRPGQLNVTLNTEALAEQLACSIETISEDQLTLEAPFQTRRRGVELKLRYSDGSATMDRTLVQNVIKARHWLSLIIDGKSFAQIAELEGLPLRRVQDLTYLAFLSPEIVEGISSGENPSGLTTDYLIKKRFSAVWSQQHEQFAQL